MADSNKLVEVCAMLAERDQEFRPLREAATQPDQESGEPYWSVAALAKALGIQKNAVIQSALNRAKVAADKADLPFDQHFRDGSQFGQPNDVFLSKYTGLLFVMSCDPKHGTVGKAQVFFTLQVDRQRLEDEKRLKTRLDVAQEQGKLTGAAKECGVADFAKFNGMGIQGLYGGLNVDQVKRLKGLAPKSNHLDFAGSEELAANLFRITQTRAALARQGFRSEAVACNTHKQVAEGVRKVILEAGNTPPERLPAAGVKIDQLATKKKRELTGKLNG